MSLVNASSTYPVDDGFSTGDLLGVLGGPPGGDEQADEKLKRSL